ncbi:MAG: N-acetylglucosamine-6-phosphate deacetylase [Opitutaceae bacterium]|nr:N-acetylglucosamine-6-phosphate deacetylase [Opitutaceae bacterium]MBP9913425.1 N-acetylglucosamine-6-phosphate deacetylase [Opitutaceae bacterium]
MKTLVHDAIDRHTGQPVRLTWVDGKIQSIAPLTGTPSAGLPLLLPPLLDIQVNGYAGVDFQRDDCTQAELERAATGLAEAACGSFFLTLITQRWEKMLARVRHYRTLRAASPLLQRRMAGWHLEGPFMSPKPGFHGAHPPECMEPPSGAKLHELKAMVGEDPVLLTMAPEWPEAPAAIRVARALGFRVWLGHTDATVEQISAAIEAGAEGFTHLGNGCPGEIHRHDNIIFRVLDEPQLRASLIPDRIHVSPVLFRLMHQVLGDARICYTTDAMAAAGAGPGIFDLAGMKVEVGTDGVVRQPGKSNYAGSSLAPLEGIRRAAAMLRRQPAAVWDYFSTQPVKFMGLAPALAVGGPADFCLLHAMATGTKIEIHFVGEPLREVVWNE